ncbi:MAG: WD40 repeat domain-containing protein [Deltaproteobacteria bacterium]|nr:WD40 repeat domain-containing protein [Deltaproteobacteria bacterium]
MFNIESWDWESKEKMLADTAKWKDKFEDVWEPYISQDGEKIASIVKIGEGEHNIAVNEGTWEEPFEKIWYSRFSPDGRLTALITKDMEWTMAVDGKTWEQMYEYIWDTKFSADGKIIAATTKVDSVYGITINEKTLECPVQLESIASHVISPDGKISAAIAQTVPLGQADLDGFLKGSWSVVVNGKPWKNNFVDVYGLTMSNDGKNIAVEYRDSICEYGILVNEKPWNEKFACTWEPVFHPKNSDEITAPVRQWGQWFLATNGRIVWDNGFYSLLYPTYSPDGNNIAAAVAPQFAKWTIAVNGQPWSVTFGECIQKPCFSPDGRKVAAIAKDKGNWLLVVDGAVLGEAFDNIWEPVFSPNDDKVICKVEKNGKYAIAVNGKIRRNDYEALWNPVVSPDGTKVMICGVEDGKYYRKVVPLSDI